MSRFDAIVLAAGRLPPQNGETDGGSLKAVISIAGRTPLAAIVTALRASQSVGRIVVIGPRSLRDRVSEVDEWIDEQPSGEENALAGLRAARTQRALLSASDVPFVQAAHVEGFLALVPPDADFAYPVFERDRFLAEFPGGRSRFARVGKGYWTGGSMCLINVGSALRNAPFIRRCFRARRSLIAMASLLGPNVLVRYCAGTLAVEDIERRIGRLSGGAAYAIRGAHPALAMDCDSAADVEYARSLSRRGVAH